MKKSLLFATAILALASCTSETYLGTEEELATVKGEQPISFGSGLNAVTRADKTGAAAAADLNNQFIVWGEKGEVNAGETGANVTIVAGATGREGQLVFKNYLVDWVDNSSYTTTSNTKGWEYVGLKLNDGLASPATTTYSGNLTPNSGTDPQTIKYWDYGAASYTYTAVSAKPADITAGDVQITKITSGANVYAKGYTVALTASADLDKLYFSERVNITKTANTDRTEPNKYGGNVTFRFHNTSTKVRVAMYETIPGYSVTINKFTVDEDGADPAFGDMVNDITTNFAANLQYSPKGVAGSMDVTYVSAAGATQNWPIVAFTPTGGKTKVLALGTNLKANTELGTSITAATYDTADNPATLDVNEDKAYTSVFPNESNTQNMKVKLSYTLTAPVTGETITVTNATAEIPADYLKWKPGFAYTYIFKISDNTNGYTDPSAVDPSGLYPITFDAVEMLAEDGSAEYITTVSEPSITTFGVNSTTGKYVTGGNEYAAGSDIYATIMDGSAVKDFTLGTDVNVYLVTTSDATNFPITEASVAEALAESPVGTAKISCENKNTDGTTSFTAAPDEVTTVPGENGVNITGTHALKLTGAVATTTTTAYAIEYIKTAATYHTTSEAHTFADADELATWEASHYKLYDNADGTTPATATNAEKTYYKRTSVNNVGTYAYKVIKVTAAP